MELKEYRRAIQDFRLVGKALPADPTVKANLVYCERELIKANFAKAIHVDTFDLEETAIGRIEEPPLDTYAGPRLAEFHRVPETFVAELVEWFRLEKRLPLRYAYMILHMANGLLRAQPTLVRVPHEEGCKFTIVGDLHGQLFDLLHLFALNGFPGEQHGYLFNGDFVDRGQHSVEIVLLLMALKCAHPGRIHLNRGNHESSSINRMHGFMDECKKKYPSGGEVFFSMANRVFNSLPLAHVVGQGVFVVHGGLPGKPEDADLDKIAGIDRFGLPPVGSLFSQLLWSDPRPAPGAKASHRGEGVLFGPDVTAAFLERNALRYLVRSHEWESGGYRLDHEGKCVTIFSAPNYTGVVSKAAVINLSPDGAHLIFFTYDAAPYQGKAPPARPNPAGQAPLLL